MDISLVMRNIKKAKKAWSRASGSCIAVSTHQRPHPRSQLLPFDDVLMNGDINQIHRTFVADLRPVPQRVISSHKLDNDLFTRPPLAEHCFDRLVCSSSQGEYWVIRRRRCHLVHGARFCKRRSLFTKTTLPSATRCRGNMTTERSFRPYHFGMKEGFTSSKLE